MSEKSKELQRFKSKLKVWTALHGIELGSRRNIQNGDFVYKEACNKCFKYNADSCPATKGKKIWVMNVRTMRRYSCSREEADRKGSNSKYIWCVEWVKHV